MGTRLDQVLAIGMARLRIAPVPTGGALGAPAPPPHPKRQLSGEGEVAERRGAKLRLVEGALEGLIGKKPSNAWRQEALHARSLTSPAPQPGERRLTDDERRIVADYLRDPREHDLGALADQLGLTKDQLTRVVRSEQKRIARIAFQERAAINALGEARNDAIKEYVDALEEERDGLLGMRESVAGQFSMGQSQVKTAAYRELMRRRRARAERDAPIPLQDDTAVKYHRRPHLSRARTRVESLRPLNEAQTAALADWARTRAVATTVRWNVRVQELRELSVRLAIPLAQAVRYMKEHTRFKTGFKAMDGKGYRAQMPDGSPLSESEVAITRSEDFRAMLEKEERERAAEEAYWMRALEEEQGSSTPAWLSDMLDQWESAFDAEAFNASEYDTTLAQGAGQIEIELAEEEEMQRQLQAEEHGYDALEAMLLAHEPGIPPSDDDRGKP